MALAGGTAIIAAVSKNGVIGNNGSMPWHCPEDLAFFKRKTLNKPIVMGRKTAESIGRPLPERENIVVTRNPHMVNISFDTARSLQQAYTIARDYSHDEILIIGGGDVYCQAIGFVHRLYITEFDQEFRGDTYFPYINPKEWVETQRVRGKRCTRKLGYSFVTYERRN